MHFEILVEDSSGMKMVEILVEKIISSSDHTFCIKSYKGIGNIPKNLKSKTDPSKRILLDQLPRLLRGYGATYKTLSYEYVLIIVCDLDQKCFKLFREELFTVLKSCVYKPNVRFCIAIEEGEAWLLGDIDAIKKAYPNAKIPILESYKNDSICGTWEKLADAIYDGGSSKLKDLGFSRIGHEKTIWAEKIAPHIDISNNKSPSFNYFISKITELI